MNKDFEQKIAPLLTHRSLLTRYIAKYLIENTYPLGLRVEIAAVFYTLEIEAPYNCMIRIFGALSEHRTYHKIEYFNVERWPEMPLGPEQGYSRKISAIHRIDGTEIETAEEFQKFIRFYVPSLHLPEDRRCAK